MKLFLILMLTALVKYSYQDIPVHCLRQDIIGVWIINASSLAKVKSGHEMKCGHDEPSSEATSYMADPKITLDNEIQLVLKEDDSAMITIKQNQQSYDGKWTMVYNEGFNVEVGEYSFFAFSKYTKEKSGKGIEVFHSMCYSTLVGWYTNRDRTKRGCYKATKKGVNPQTVTHVNTKKDGIDVDFNEDMSMSFKEKNVHVYVEDLNKKLANKSWTAVVYPENINNTYKNNTHTDRTTVELPEIIKLDTLKNLHKFKQVMMKSTKSFNPSLYADNFNWKHLLKPAINQGECGSCYAISTVRMMEARLKLLYDHDVSLSAQHAMDCSYYNQGCGGGFSFLVMKFVNEFEMIPEHCKPYMGVNGKCSESCDTIKLPFIYKMSDYKYLGGSYGKCNEKLMMQELYLNGPFVVSFNSDYNFMFYRKGIYHSITEDTYKMQGMKKPQWQKVDHSVLLVGWGVDDASGEKYWLLQNTQGPEWGEKGFFRMIRGTDEFAIESMCEVGTPVIVDNQSKLGLMPNRKSIPVPSPVAKRIIKIVKRNPQPVVVINKPTRVQTPLTFEVPFPVPTPMPMLDPMSVPMLDPMSAPMPDPLMIPSPTKMPFLLTKDNVISSSNKQKFLKMIYGPNTKYLKNPLEIP